MSPARTKAGERLPYLLSKLKAPSVLERLEQTATLAREQEWPYERFLETLLEAEVFARDASGARMRIRAAGFPASGAAGFMSTAGFFRRCAASDMIENSSSPS